ncbi:MAG: hypothetical protein CMH25_01335 [Micavibrio sp.]|nr:hypothetical protein [Micavibrio sp.]|tara:strand:+ start:860 stop:1222 length:363 start_codon:yes stop_codon:yes gene_type:complete
MQNLSIQRTIAIVICLSLFTSWISPACAFISGNSTTIIEICTSYGIEKIVNQSNEDTQTSEDFAERKCDFCLASHLNALSPDLDFHALIQQTSAQTKLIIQDKSTHFILSYKSRAPPLPA